ncbi:hypothetical protein F2Q69_00040572 [Brassica cretica]|uniref:Uncharacterized protein n=1 Tax=Brassica cretica TaxID=69181 RepID=A0A8S9NHY4_BRACR|nr:hypothetical protein F2Q69_00040572 [Brassica cretica]
MCILAIIVQIAFYLHIQTHVFRIPVMFTRPVVFPTAFMSFFSVNGVQDIPDTEGDKILGLTGLYVMFFWQQPCGLELSLLI